MYQYHDYTYASAHVPPGDWAAHLSPYLFDFSPEKLTIGKFCQLADGVAFITASANHRHSGFASFPFMIFTGAHIMPGATSGNGVIVGAGAVVSGDVPDYAIVAGNPARIVQMRFDIETVDALLALAWWNWDIDRIVANEQVIVGADPDALRDAAPDWKPYD